MNRFALALGAVTALASSAMAADLRVAPVTKAPPPVAYTWTGCYFGGFAGGAVGQSSWARDASDRSSLGGLLRALGGDLNFGSETANGAIVGGQAGCDYQFSPNFVRGLQGDFAWSDIKGGHSKTQSLPNGAILSTFTTTASIKTDRIATITGRLGYASDRALFYVKGGAAWSHSDYTFGIDNVDTIPSAVLERHAAGADRWGWTAGAGFEYLLSRNVSAFIEYDYLDFGSKAVSFTCTSVTLIGVAGPSCATRNGLVLNIGQQVNQVKFGANYRF